MGNFITFSFHKYVVIMLVIYPGTYWYFTKLWVNKDLIIIWKQDAKLVFQCRQHILDKKITKLYVLKGFLNKVQNAWFLIFWNCNGQLRLFYPNMSFYVSITYLSYKKETISYVLLIIYITKCYFISFKFINIFLRGALLYSYPFLQYYC